MAYIDSEAFKRKLIDEKSFFPAIVARALEEMPVADVVEVVRCKDCVHNQKSIRKYNRSVCARISRWVGDDDYCDQGERRDT